MNTQCPRMLYAIAVIASLLGRPAVAQPPSKGSEIGQPVSAAMKRHVVDDSENELYTRFRYQPIKGLGYEPGVHRRDPSTIIKVGDLYYVWYTYCRDPRYKWLNADIWYATSPDGVNWKEQGPAVERGAKGSWDDFSVFTTNVLVVESKYYLCYQARSFGSGRNVVGMAKTDKPDGPWTKLPEPILWTTPDGKLIDEQSGYPNWSRYEQKGSWDSGAVHDPGIIPRWGKYWLPDKFDDPEDGQGFTWGLCHYGTSDWCFLLRFECDLHRDSEKQLEWKHFRHYSTVRDVMINPGRFGVPAEALHRRP